MRLILAAGIATMLVLAGPTAARQSAGNLVQDPGAEAAAATDGNSVIPIPGWTATGTFTAGVYGAHGFPPAIAGGGKNLFAGGPGGAVSTATQVVSVSSSASAIDAGTVNSTLDGWLGGWEGQEDSATVSAIFEDAGQRELGTITIGPVTATQRNSRSTLLERTAKGNVPRGTRSIVVTITATRSSGVYNDGYADNISLTLTSGTAQPPAGSAKATFWFSGSGDAADSQPSDYIGSRVRGSGSLKLARSVKQGGVSKVTGGTGTIRLIHHYALRTEKLWLKLHGGGFVGRDDVLVTLLGVTASNTDSCPKGRAGAMTLYDNSTWHDHPDEIILLVCGLRYRFGEWDRTKAAVRIHAT